MQKIVEHKGGEMFGLLGAESENKVLEVITAIETPLNYAAIGMLALIGACAIVFAVYVAFRLAKAEDEGKRKEAKKQLLWSVIAVFAAVAIFVLISTVFNNEFFGDTSKKVQETADKEGKPIVDAVNVVIVAISQAISAFAKLGVVLGAFFGIYIGIRLAMAEDEGKRKEAKNQLLWTLVAIISVFILSVIIDTVIWNVLIENIQNT